jgi:hypothetical protein
VNQIRRPHGATVPAPGTAVVSSTGEETSLMTTLANPLFWNMKIKIAILTLATFAALC